MTELVRKLGIGEGRRVGVVGDPGHFASLMEPLPPGAALEHDPQTPCPMLVMFAPSAADFRNRLPGALRPKKASPLFQDLAEDLIRREILPLGLVDVKVCAIDQNWSGLRLVVRKTHRPARNPNRKFEGNVSDDEQGGISPVERVSLLFPF